MEIVFIREKQNNSDILSQVKNSIVSRIEVLTNTTSTDKTESFILPIVPKDNPFSQNANIDNYKGLKKDYNIPSHKSLQSISWSSFFPVNKNYGFQHTGSNNNGYDYVDFLNDRQVNQLPFRLIAYDLNPLGDTLTTEAGNIISRTKSFSSYSKPVFKILCDKLFLVKEFKYSLDSVRDIAYSLSLEEFNADLTRPINWAEAGVSTSSNIITKFALQKVGLI